MRHGRRGRKLGRTASHKRAMLNNLATSLFLHGAVRTTHAKAKELRGVADRLITFAKRGDLHARRQVLRRIRNPVVVSRLFDEIGPSFESRQGGYTRVLKLGTRRGDQVEVCLVELVGEELRADYAETRKSERASAPEKASAEEVEEKVESQEADEVEEAGEPESEGSKKAPS